mmetsp:Transcript_84361/g.172190  ORF Transcript_84361/g.172190 Transcript_84361/m.172190 type:complete len:243 (+) Transcript_84361:996-1724(+)
MARLLIVAPKLPRNLRSHLASHLGRGHLLRRHLLWMHLLGMHLLRRHLLGRHLLGRHLTRHLPRHLHTVLKCVGPPIHKAPRLGWCCLWRSGITLELRRMALHFAVHLSGWSLLRAHRALEIKLPLVRIDARLIAPQALARLTRSLRRRRGSFGGRMAPDHVGCGGDCFHLRLGGSSEARGWSTSAHSSEASILRGLLKRLANCACHSSKAPSLLWSRLVKGIRPTRISKHDVLFFCGLSVL